MQNAKPEVVELERKKKADTEDKIRVVRESLAGIKLLKYCPIPSSQNNPQSCLAFSSEKKVRKMRT
jgi:hypothetical protein